MEMTTTRDPITGVLKVVLEVSPEDMVQPDFTTFQNARIRNGSKAGASIPQQLDAFKAIAEGLEATLEG